MLAEVLTEHFGSVHQVSIFLNFDDLSIADNKKHMVIIFIDFLILFCGDQYRNVISKKVKTDKALIV
ncbi:hypothetical protein AR688_09940 [Rheinheimera sp. EpRS3]|nr:hypothetical protein AR688_09940 [Rheinheimera sp. EpRS3]